MFETITRSGRVTGAISLQCPGTKDFLYAEMTEDYHVVKWNGRNCTGHFEKTQKMTLLP